MYKELYGYLILYKELTVPGIGTFLLNKESAVVDFPNRVAHSPSYAVSHTSEEKINDIEFFNRLGALLDKSTNEVSQLFNDFVLQVVTAIRSGGKIHWNNIGELSRSLDGSVKFVPAKVVSSQTAVPAEKVLRENAGHMVRVGEEERTSEQMTEFYGATVARKNYRMLIAAAIAILALLFIAWHFSRHGVDATANNKRSAPANPPDATYRHLAQP